MNKKKLIKIAIEVIVLVVLGYLVYDNYYFLTNKIEYAYKKYLMPDIKQTLVDNKYRRNVDYEYVKINTNTNIKNSEDAKNAIYTFLDAGWKKYSVKCDPDYATCTADVKNMVENNSYLTNLGNFVHPFNTFQKINTSFSSNGTITLEKENRYTEEQIKAISTKVDEIYNKYYDSSKNTLENIRIFHNYIINNAKYDINNTTGGAEVNSSTAYGVFFEGLGVCSGYTDAMALFLDKLNVKNYRISSSTHTWNYVYVEGAWKHLDLTWDDPINSDGSNTISDKFFIVDTNTLKNQTDTEHFFDENVYIEAK